MQRGSALYPLKAIIEHGLRVGLAVILFCNGLNAALSSHQIKIRDSIPVLSQVHTKQLDLIDLALGLFGKHKQRDDSLGITDTRLYITAAPIVEYTVATGFSPGVTGNIAWKTSVHKPTNTSSFLGAIKYTQRGQLLVPLQTTYWTAGNHINLQGDWRYFDYSQDVFGLGGHSRLADKYLVTYRYLRLYEYIFVRIAPNFYAGGGYQLDYHWRIRENGLSPGQVSDFQRYGLTTSSTASGLGLAVQYDNRENAINPEAGTAFARLQFLQNSRLLGSDQNWNSIQLDMRRYIRLRRGLLLALWSYNYITLQGSPAFLDLSGTGTDSYNNSGRGYEQNRYSGKSYLYAEAELRFGITRNGLLGAVLFSNLQSVSEPGTGSFEVVSPGIGAGLRIQFNKFSKTNACIDYGVGTHGSRGFVGNLGEVF